MPHEILSKSYLGTSQAMLLSDEELASYNAQDPLKPVVHVAHNFQHDLESLWWAVLWTLTHRSGHAPAREYADRIFQNQMTLSDARARALDSDIKVHLTKYLSPELKDFALTMEILRHIMWNTYINRAQNDLLFNANSYAFIHRVFQIKFETLILQHTGWRDYPLRVHSPETAGKTEDQSRAPKHVKLKRQRSKDSYKPTASDNQGCSDSDCNTSKLSCKRVKV